MYTRTKNRKPKKKQKNKNKAAKKAKKSPERSEGLEGSRRKKENNGAQPKPWAAIAHKTAFRRSSQREDNQAV